MIRGLAALAVLIGHARAFVFQDYGVGGGLLTAPFYMLTGLGHQAVVIFFALSGFLVGGSALREIHRGSWKAADYSIHRFTRLWTALIPALIATALLDMIGRDLLGLRGYAGEYWTLVSAGPPADAQISLTPATLLGNIAFLQTILVPVYGSDGPLWSLANEFWYYFLIPFGWLALRGGVALGWRVGAGIFAVGAGLLLPKVLVAMGLIWVVGALAFLLVERVNALAPRRRLLLLALVLLGLAAAGAYSMARPGLASDLALGLFCAMLLPCLAALPNIGGGYGRVAFGVSEISFTLYVVHFPLVALLWFALIAPLQYPVGLTGIAVWLGLIAAALIYATAMWWLFERNTGTVRRWTRARLLGTSR